MRRLWNYLKGLADDIWRWPSVDLCAGRSEDKVVQTLDWFLGWLQAFWNAPAYSWLSRRAARRWSNEQPWMYFNHLYADAWFLIIVGLAIAAPRVPGWAQLLFLALAFWRVAEMFTWYVKLLFDKGHRMLIEVERNLLFLAVDALGFVTVLAIMLETGNRVDS